MENRAAKTAWGPMVQVALEQLVPHEQRIVHDAIAFRLMPASLKGLVSLCRMRLTRNGLLNLADRRVPGIRGGILCRKRYVDERMTEALSSGIRSVVILGAGFDTRGYRLPTASSVRVYEVDLPNNIQFKRKALRRLFGYVPSHVKLVEIDFGSQDLEWVLRQAGYPEEERSLHIWEGVTQYLDEPAVLRVFEFLRKASVGSQLVFSYVRRDFIDGKKMYGLDVLYNETRVKKKLWQFGLEPQAIGRYLDQYGWKELEQVGAAEYQERYLRPLGRAMPVMEVERMVHAEKLTN